MEGTENQGDKIKKTGYLLAALNLILWPIYYADSKIGVSASIALTVGSLFALHEVGKQRRPVENAAVNVRNFFAPATGDSGANIANAVENIAEGGAAVVAELQHPRAPH